MWSFKRYGLVNERSQNGQQCCLFLSALWGEEKFEGKNEFSFVELVALLLLLLLFVMILTNFDVAFWYFFVRLDESLLSRSSSSLSLSLVFELLILKLVSICKLSFCILSTWATHVSVPTTLDLTNSKNNRTFKRQKIILFLNESIHKKIFLNA